MLVYCACFWDIPYCWLGCISWLRSTATPCHVVLWKDFLHAFVSFPTWAFSQVRKCIWWRLVTLWSELLACGDSGAPEDMSEAWSFPWLWPQGFLWPLIHPPEKCLESMMLWHFIVCVWVHCRWFYGGIVPNRWWRCRNQYFTMHGLHSFALWLLHWPFVYQCSGCHWASVSYKWCMHGARGIQNLISPSDSLSSPTWWQMATWPSHIDEEPRALCKILQSWVNAYILWGIGPSYFLCRFICYWYMKMAKCETIKSTEFGSPLGPVEVAGSWWIAG